jgi:hypothetical protein
VFQEQERHGVVMKYLEAGNGCEVAGYSLKMLFLHGWRDAGLYVANGGEGCGYGGQGDDC